MVRSFARDQLAAGRQLRVLTVADTFSQHAPILDVRFCFCGEDMENSLDRVSAKIGYPKTICVDNGPEFGSRDMDLWAYQHGVVQDCSLPGKPTDNAFIEAFNGKFRQECLNAHLLLSHVDADQKLEDWRRNYYDE